MGIKEERNARISAYLERLYSMATDESFQIDESEYKSDMDKLFTTTAWGFREILLVVAVGMELDNAFRASTGFYDCNPRAIYEGPIKEFFIEKEIPHRKSGPLNVAKATVGLDHTWAAQRRPSDVAEKVVALVEYMENGTGEQGTRVSKIATSLIRRLIAESSRMEALSVEIEPSADPDFLYILCHELITKTPDSGNTPQKIAAFLLKNYHLEMNTGIVVTGEEDRASVTSTTSKKPGDVNEESTDGEIFKVYEITVKPFDLARIRDSYDCVGKYNEENESNLNEIIVICRKEDCPEEMECSTLNSYIGRFAYQDIMYYFWDIFEWISDTLQRMTPSGRIGFYSDLNTYIADINTAETVKILWRKLHE